MAVLCVCKFENEPLKCESAIPCTKVAKGKVNTPIWPDFELI